MLLSSCKWVSGVSGEMKFGILVGGLKTTYHALRSWLDLRIWKSKHFLMYNFSAADQSTAAGHEDLSLSLSRSPLSVFHILTRSAFCFRIGAPAAVDLDDSGSFPIQGSHQVSWALASHPLSHPPLHPQISPNPLFAPPWPWLGH